MIRAISRGCALASFGALAVAMYGCTTDTGSAIVTFPAYAAGPSDAASPLIFESESGFAVKLTRAIVHVGAVYLTTSEAANGSASTSCVEPGRYVGEVLGGTDVDLLSNSPQAFPLTGDGTADVVSTAELWLTHSSSVTGSSTSGDDINQETAPTGPVGASQLTGGAVVGLQGEAVKNGQLYKWSATVTISEDNRGKAVTDPSQPGLNPICKRRIIEVAPPPFQVDGSRALVVRIDPRGWFNSIDFSQLDVDPNDPTAFVIPDNDASGTVGATAGRNLLTGILTGVLPSGASAYSFQFVPK